MANASESPDPRLPAAQYLRMSTEHQRYSLDNQAAAIARYAQARGYEVVRTYEDAGISGLSLKHREGLQQLLANVLSGDPGFELILVYDVSRWGRFQNPDQSAHYEFLCAQAGVRVEYCAEPFENDGSVTSSLVKGLKRVMAAEYSRELSGKIGSAKLRSAHRGFWLGGAAGYGLRRQVVDDQGRPGPVLGPGERKAVQGHHVVLVPGPPKEVAVVRRIFREFVQEKLSCVAIAARLNSRNILTSDGVPWTGAHVGRILRNPKYVGDLVYNRSASYLGGPTEPRPEADWVHTRGAFQGIVERSIFEAAQVRWRARREPTNEEVLERLRQLLARHGRLTRELIDAAPDVLSTDAIRARFGSLHNAYAAIGYGGIHRRRVHLETDELLRRLARLFIREGRITQALVIADPDLPTWHTVSDRLGSIRAVRARLGVVALTRKDLASPVGQARAAAMARRLQALAGDGGSIGEGGAGTGPKDGGGSSDGSR